MYIKVKVTASAKKEFLSKKSEDTFLISVKEPAEQNQANKRILELIAGYFGISSKCVRIISGHHSPHKILSLERHK
jgi:uncharacterized protein YggU (UPF0235/DUF167 family)